MKEEREKEFRALPSKELRKIASRRRAGLNSSEKFGARRDSLFAVQILSERKKAERKSR
jgi:hypothetical protein